MRSVRGTYLILSFNDLAFPAMQVRLDHSYSSYSITMAMLKLISAARGTYLIRSFKDPALPAGSFN